MTRRADVAIVDHGLGNLFSVQQACQQVGLSPSLTTNVQEIDQADAVVIPGVGAFSDAMDTLNRLGLVELLRDIAARGTPIFGICLGFQLLMEASEEFGYHAGLGLIPGTVKKLFSEMRPVLDQRVRPRVPQVGWNQVYRPPQDRESHNPWTDTMLHDIPDGTYMYFVHSYYVVPKEMSDVLAVTAYGKLTYCSAASRGSLFGCQFHPERSGGMGLRMYSNIARLVRAAAR